MVSPVPYPVGLRGHGPVRFLGPDRVVIEVAWTTGWVGGVIRQVAVARRLVIRRWVMLRDQTTWSPPPVARAA